MFEAYSIDPGEKPESVTDQYIVELNTGHVAMSGERADRRGQHANRAKPHLTTTGLPMQAARFFLISPPPRWLRGVLCHVFAGLRFNAKVGPRLLTFILSLINKNGFQPVPNSSTTLCPLESEPLPLPSLGPISHLAP